MKKNCPSVNDCSSISLSIALVACKSHWTHHHTPRVENTKREVDELTKARTLLLNNPMSSGIKKFDVVNDLHLSKLHFLGTLLNHQKSIHSNEISFLIKCEVESYMFKINNCNLYYKHVRAHHNNLDSYSLSLIGGITIWVILMKKKSKLYPVRMMNSANPRIQRNRMTIEV